MQRQATNQEKIFANHKSHEELVSRPVKYMLNSIIRKQPTNPIKNEQKI